MPRFTISDNQVHTIAKLLGVAFHSLNKGTAPSSIHFTTQELESVFLLHEDMFKYLDHLESLASDHLLIEEMTSQENNP